MCFHIARESSKLQRQFVIKLAKITVATTKCLLVKRAAKENDLVPFSPRMNDLANESTDVTNGTVLLAYFRYILQNFPKPLKIYRHYFEKIK